MSSTSAPISAQRFAEAIEELPLANLHLKAAELRNSIAHLESSNQQLQPFVDEGDADFKEAIEENVIVIQRMQQRIQLLQQEVERRGYQWGKNELNIRDSQTDGDRANYDDQEMASAAISTTEQGTRSVRGSLGDEELARRLRGQLEQDEDMDEDGVHL